MTTEPLQPSNYITPLLHDGMHSPICSSAVPVLMGNILLTCRTPDGRGSGGKVVLCNGTVQELDRPTAVAELMLDHPQQVVVDLRALAAGRNSAPLPADHVLERGKVYAMLPMGRGKAAGGSTSDEAHRVLQAMATSQVPRLQSLLRVVGLAHAAVGRAERGNKVLAAPAEDERSKVGEVEWCSELLMRQYSSKRWQPSLGTIVEKNLEKKVPHWLF